MLPAKIKVPLIQITFIPFILTRPITQFPSIPSLKNLQNLKKSSDQPGIFSDLRSALLYSRELSPLSSNRQNLSRPRASKNFEITDNIERQIDHQAWNKPTVSHRLDPPDRYRKDTRNYLLVMPL
jgi:hypothetical protein